MCIDAPDWTTNSFSSSWRVDASRHQFSEGEKNVAISCPFNLKTFLASFHAASRAPCSFCLFLRPILKFWSIGTALMRITWANHIRAEGFWSRMSAWRTTAFVNFTRWIRFCMSELFRKIDFGCFISRKTELQMSCARWPTSSRSPLSTHDRCHALQQVTPICRDFRHGWPYLFGIFE